MLHHYAYSYPYVFHDSRDSSVGRATGYGVRFPTRARDFSQLHSVQTGYGAHPALHPMGIGCTFPGGKAAEA
jgi:hypothetical protein